MIKKYLVKKTGRKWELLGDRGAGFERIVAGNKSEITRYLASYLNVAITSISPLIVSGKVFEARGSRHGQ